MTEEKQCARNQRAHHTRGAYTMLVINECRYYISIVGNELIFEQSAISRYTNLGGRS